MSPQHRRSKTLPNSSLPAPGAGLIGTHARRGNDRLGSRGANSPQLQCGVNPLYGSNITAAYALSQKEGHTRDNKTKQQHDQGLGTPAARPRGFEASNNAAAMRTSSGGSRGVSNRVERSRTSPARVGSPQSTLATRTTRSSSSSRPGRRTGTASAALQSSKGWSTAGGGSAKGTKAVSQREMGAGPAQLVPAILAPVPPPPPKRKVVKERPPSTGDVETGDPSEASVLEDAPDKTAMEILQTYLKKQDLSTRIALIVLLLVLAGGVFGAYVVMILKAVQDQNAKYIALCTTFTLVLLWVLWKVSTLGIFCFPPKNIKVILYVHHCSTNQ